MDDSALISRMREGDRKAFNILYARHVDICRGYAELMVGNMFSTDIVQDVFLKVWDRRETISVSDSLRPYLLKAIYNRALNSIRRTSYRQQYRNEFSERIERLSSQTYDPDANEVIRKLYLKDDMAAIEDAVRLLPDRCRQIFRMSYIDGMSHKEIALKLGITVSTVDNHIYKALKMLRDNLSDPRIYMLVLFSLLFR